MFKIPSLFVKNWEGNRQATRTVNPVASWVMLGEGVATEKFDGTACMYNGKWWKRYDAKRWFPDGEYIECSPKDPETGHHFMWVPVGEGPEDKWYREGITDAVSHELPEGGTFELVGPKVQGNPYHLEHHQMWRHGSKILSNVPLDYDGLRTYLSAHAIEGIVWRHQDDRMAKLKRKDFGLEWPIRS